MARRTARPQPTREGDLPALTRSCPGCGGTLRAAYETRRTLTTPDGLVRIGVQIRRRRDRRCRRHGVPPRSEPEGRPVLPQHELGLDVAALVGTLRHARHRSPPEVHAELVRRGVPICLRSVGDLPGRYDELLASSRSDAARLRRVTAKAGRVMIRNAVAGALDAVPHQLCQLHYPRDAALPVYEAGRHAKAQSKKEARGIRPTEREMGGRQDPEAGVIRGYCAACGRR